jgi:hypothetical protein
VRTIGSALLALAGSAALFLALVGLLSAKSTPGLVLAGYVFLGGGLLLVRLAWRVHMALPSSFRAPDGASREEVREFARDLASRQWRATAIFLGALTVVYLVLGLFLEGTSAGLDAALITAAMTVVLGLLSWWQGRPAPT